MISLKNFISEKLLVNKNAKFVPSIEDIKELYLNLTLDDIDKKYYDKKIPKLYDGKAWYYKMGDNLLKWFKVWMLLTIYGETKWETIEKEIGHVNVGPLSMQKVFNYDKETDIISANPVSKWETKDISS